VTEMPFVHIGVLVPDLGEAIERYFRLGVSFMDPLSVHVDRLVEDGEETQLDLRIVFSHQGPPQWELLEITGDGIYGPHHAGGSTTSRCWRPTLHGGAMSSSRRASARRPRSTGRTAA